MDQDNLQKRVLATLEHFVEDWGLDCEITSNTQIVEDLGFDSIDVIQFTVALEKAFDNCRIGFQDLLMQDGRYVDDLSVAQFEAFLEIRLAPA